MSQVLSGCAVRAEIQKEMNRKEESHRCSRCGEPAIVEITNELSTVYFLCAVCDSQPLLDLPALPPKMPHPHAFDVNCRCQSCFPSDAVVKP